MLIERSLPGHYQTDRQLTETGSASVLGTRRRTESGRVRTCDQGRSPEHVIGEELFRGALIRERKIADRLSQRFGVLLVSPSAPEAVNQVVWSPVIDAMATVKRDTDVLGWFEQRQSLGIIFPEVGSFDDVVVEGIEDRARRELGRRLDPSVARRFSVKLHMHEQRAQESREATPSVDTLLSALESPRREAPWYQPLKRAIDLAASLTLLVLLAPVFLVIAALVKVSSRGPVFFRQSRIGQHATPFQMMKFRTMRSDASTAVHQDYVTWFIKSSGKAQKAGTNEVFKIANDPRVTAIGRFLRRTSLDELPQLWNVVRGEMSLVGPRPPLPYEVEQYQAWHCRRVLEAKPGITGLWQVAGRSRTTFDEMVRLDLRYARSCSLWTDIKILVATPRAVIGGKGAC